MVVPPRPLRLRTVPQGRCGEVRNRSAVPAATLRHMAGANLLDELAAIWDAVPLPAEAWHPWVAELRRVDRGVRAAVAILAEDAGARGELEAALEAGDPPPDDGHDGVGEALRLLAALPRPVGHHPFLHEIAPGLEAAGVLLAAVGRSEAARRHFEALVP